MKIKLLYILIPVLISAACSGNIRKDEIKNINHEISLQTIAVFKSAEQINENEWHLIFRKLDDCQYILFYTDIRKLNTFRDTLILTSENTYIANPDFINLRFNINYTEETATDPATGEHITINRLKNISRSQSERFAEAGFNDDTQADDFIMNLKKYVKNDSAAEISDMIAYPLNPVIKKKKIKINEPESFIKDYNIIFNKRVKSSILNQSPADVKVSSKGIMIGTGEIWINRVDGKICITSINSY